MLNFKNAQEINDVIAAIHKFIEQDVFPLKEHYKNYLENERLFYDENGYLSAEVQQAFLEVRKVSTAAGFYNMFGDSSLGGEGDTFGSISNSPYAHYAMTFAITDQASFDKRQGGISCFLVPVDGKTCTNTSVISTLGNLGGEIGILVYENTRVHKKYIIGELHNGFDKALEGVDVGRIVMSANCVGVAQWALQKAVDYSNERQTFGQKIGSHQTIQIMLADCAMDIYAGRNMLLNCVWKMDNDKQLPIKEISMVKAYCTEMAQRVIDRCMQIHGGMGITNELKLVKAWSWSRAMRIPDGTTEIQKITIAKQLLKGNSSFS
ncbi:acyl-CoA dehydrogenase family protein [Kurthia sibirica]|uniref:Acyl-CoA dehydrogenase/oxidase C-terminal domain-containing protein n=1 Tax=Kurthia sibirica TaxID=202750 RepID=A0A2U3AMZ6_9BACL|nr:acyl-CoA dehydrogenase [Kurthia sibirica]PWI25897.1 hypothetical protein DEX24_05015 [Kurthia sibirica]GEK34248.1 hypothetical protein KSI01_17810 [Kurthia sibirica]